MNNIGSHLAACAMAGAAALASHAWAPSAWATDQDDGSEGIEEVVVIATRTENPLSKIGSSVSVITEADLAQHQSTFLDDALRGLPGLSVSRSGSVGGVTSVFMRGASSSNTLVLIDGVEVNDAAAPGGAFDFAGLATADIARVEVLRGAQSLLYGSRALGGVINIITRRGAPGFHAGGSTELGAFNTARGNVNLSGGGERITFSLSGSAYSTDGISAADKRDGNAEKDGLDDFTFSGRLSAKLSEVLSLEGHVRVGDSKNDFDRFDFFAGGIVDGNNVSKSTQIEAGGGLTLKLFDGRVEALFKGGRSGTNRDSFEDGSRNIAALGQRREFSFQGNLYIDDNNILTVGAEHEKTSMDFTFFSAFGDFPTLGQANIDSVYGQFQTTLKDALTLTAGLRQDNHTTFGGATTFRFTGAYDLAASGTILRATYGEGFKAPSLFDLFDPFSGNRDLRPEENRSFDAGVEQNLLGGRASIRATYFHVDTRNLIGFDFSTFTSANTSLSRAGGLELEVKAGLGGGINIRANYSLTATRDKVLGTRLALRPKHVASLEAALAPGGPFSGSLGLNYTGRKRDSSGVTLDDYVLVELRAAYKFTDRLALFGRVENLLDKHYQEVFGFGSPGISAFFGLRLAG